VIFSNLCCNPWIIKLTSIFNFGFTQELIKLERMIDQFMNIKLSSLSLGCCVASQMPTPAKEEEGEGFSCSNKIRLRNN